MLSHWYRNRCLIYLELIESRRWLLLDEWPLSAAISTGRVKAYPIRLRRNRGSSTASKISVKKFKVIIDAANKKSIAAASC